MVFSQDVLAKAAGTLNASNDINIKAKTSNDVWLLALACGTGR